MRNTFGLSLAAAFMVTAASVAVAYDSGGSSWGGYSLKQTRR